MKSVAAIIGKNLVLVGMVLITVLTFLKRSFSWHDLLIIQLAMGTVYVLLSVFELTNSAFRKNLPTERFSYLPGSFLMFRAIKVGMFLMFGIVLALMPNVIMILHPICFVIAFSELINLALKLSKKLCFVNVDKDFVMIALDRIEKIFASEIERIEYRHEIIYFVKKNGKTSEIKMFSLREPTAVLEKIKVWISDNKISVSEESLRKLGG